MVDRCCGGDLEATAKVVSRLKGETLDSNVISDIVLDAVIKPLDLSDSTSPEQNCATCVMSEIIKITGSYKEI